MDITIKINTDNAAFDGEYFKAELSRILDTVKYELDIKVFRITKLYDINGNTCGYIQIKESNNESDSIMV